MDSAKLWKMSGEYRAYMKSMLRAPLNHLPVEKVIPVGRRLFSGPDGTIVRFDEPPEAHDPREPRFDGQVCVLIGPLTFSSAVDLADGIKTYKLATLVGEETGGRPNTFGEVYSFRTPDTGFLVGVSSARVRASERRHDGSSRRAAGHRGAPVGGRRSRRPRPGARSRADVLVAGAGAVAATAPVSPCRARATRRSSACATRPSRSRAACVRCA